MILLDDLNKRTIRLTDERRIHIENDHPEMKDQIEKIKETLLDPEIIVLSNTDSSIEMFYKYYKITPVTSKHMCILIKVLESDQFIITSYFTNSIKKGEVIWKSK